MTVSEAYKYIYSRLSDMQIHIFLDKNAEDISQEDCDEIIKFLRDKHGDRQK